DEHALKLCRTIVSTQNTPAKTLPADFTTAEDPAYDAEDLYGIVNVDVRRPYDVHEVIARIVDGSRFDEFKARYGSTLVTGFARSHGCLVGMVANIGGRVSEWWLWATHVMGVSGYGCVRT